MAVRKAKGGPLTLPAAYPLQDREAGLSREKRGRQVTAYDPEVAREICQLIGTGYTLREITRRGTGYPTDDTVYGWLQNQPDFRSAFAAAREISAYVLEEEAIDTVRSLMSRPDLLSQIGVRAVEVLANQLRWSAERRNSAQFGNKTATSIVVPVQINTTMDLGQGGVRTDVTAPDAVYSLDAKLPALPAPETPLEVALDPEAKPLSRPAKSGPKRKLPTPEEMAENRKKHKEKQSAASES